MNAMQKPDMPQERETTPTLSKDSTDWLVTLQTVRRRAHAILRSGHQLKTMHEAMNEAWYEQLQAAREVRMWRAK